jgi:hypothetical protein
MMTIELNPGPHCGGSEVTLASSVEWFVYCSNPLCDSSGNTAEEAAKAWNTRASGWLPIETAPRDGTDVDLWIKFEDIQMRLIDCWWCPDAQSWYHPDMCGEPSKLDDCTPTHWMPIPKAPEVQP